MGNGHLVQAASYKSGEYVMSGNKEAWLDLFADDAVVQDPVGESPLDPTGHGHKGKQAISEFWDLIIAPGQIDFQIRLSQPAGDECANVVDLVNTLPGGIEIKTNMVVVYTGNSAGKITSLKAYWEYSKVQEQMDRALAGA